MTEIFNRIEMLKRRRFLRGHSTETESVLWERLRNKKIGGVRFRRQVSIGGYIVDFYCPKLHLVIEIDGRSHDTASAKIYDAVREEKLKQLGLTLLRFRNHEVLQNINDLVKRIEKFIENRSSST